MVLTWVYNSKMGLRTCCGQAAGLGPHRAAMSSCVWGRCLRSAQHTLPAKPVCTVSVWSWGVPVLWVLQSLPPAAAAAAALGTLLWAAESSWVPRPGGRNPGDTCGPLLRPWRRDGLAGQGRCGGEGSREAAGRSPGTWLTGRGLLRVPSEHAVQPASVPQSWLSATGGPGTQSQALSL